MNGVIRVLCLTPYPTRNAGVRLRIEQQLPLLMKDGITVVLSSFLDEAGYAVAFKPGHILEKAMAVMRGYVRRLRDAIRLSQYDVVFVYRESVPFGPPAVEWWARRSGTPVVYDLDEALFVPNIHPSNRAWAWLRSPHRVKWHCRAATLVTVQNAYLGHHAARWNPQVRVIPTPVDTQARHPRSARRDGPIVIGWIGSETTAAYLHLIDDALARVSAERDVIVRVVGGAFRNDRIRRLEVVDFALRQEQADLEGFDIGILPEPDDPWTRGKGGYKALLYMAAGIPVVASAVGVNTDIVADYETGICVRETDEWVAALLRLIDDPLLRDRFGRAGRVRVVERYSIDVIAPRFADALRAAARAAA